jgi:anti-sigma regulatory factor (Ser/Thr protein kinase)
MIWQGNEVEDAISIAPSITPPAILCFKKNREETIAFLSKIREAGTKAIKNKTKFVLREGFNKPRVLSYFDFSKITFISTAAAVILTSEYERVAKLNEETPPTVNLHRWSETVFRKLIQLGFFEVVGHIPERDDIVIEHGTTKTMQIVSTKNNNDLDKIDLSLSELCSLLDAQSGETSDLIVDILTALAEAISNARHHAYPPELPLPYPQLGRIWVAASVDKIQNSLTVVAYDQGVTIPVTYPLINNGYKKIINFLKTRLSSELLHPHHNDGVYIEAAMAFGGSRTQEAHRGKGLPQMKDILKKVKNGQLSVFSRGGICTFSSRAGSETTSTSQNIGGTLIEWFLELPKTKSAGRYDY